MDTVEKLSQKYLVTEPQPRDPREMNRAELEAYLQNTECFPTKVSLLEFARSHDIPVNGRTQREEIIRLCLRMIHDIPASFAGLRDAERKPKPTRASGVDARKVLENFFTKTKRGEHSDSQDIKKITTALLDSMFNCQDAGLLLAQARQADAEVLCQALEACEPQVESHVHFLASLLDLLRLETGRQELACTSLRLRACLSEALKQVAASANKKGLELCCSVPAEAPECLVGDPGRLRQILINLLENAIESTHSGEVIVEVGRSDVDSHASPEEEGQETPQVALLFTVRGGDGSASQEKPGEMGHVGSFRKGSGQFSSDEFRLSLARRFATLMQGRMEIGSDDGNGFSCSFGLRFGVDNPTDGELASQFVDLRGCSLLVVDDNEVQRRILDDLLASWGARVTLAVNEREALTFLEGQPEADPFAAIIIDGQMKDIETFVSMQRRWITENSRRVSPVIMMLASAASAKAMEQYQDVNVTAFLQKPPTPIELSQALHETLVAPPASPSEEVFDRQALWAIVDGDATLLQELIGLFDQDCPRLFFALQHALMAKRGQTIAAGASALRGVVGIFAARGVLGILALIENLGRRDDFTKVQEVLPYLTIELSRLKLALDAFGQELSTLQKD